VISAVATGTSVGRAIDVATYFLTSTYLSATVAYVIARIVYRFNARLTDAREIGSYELIARIGAGGMGEVWRAEHRLLARRVAPAGSKHLGPFTPRHRDSHESAARCLRISRFRRHQIPATMRCRSRTKNAGHLPSAMPVALELYGTPWRMDCVDPRPSAASGCQALSMNLAFAKRL
jgi:hypothetical protein